MPVCPPLPPTRAARQFFWQAFGGSDVVEEIEEIEIFGASSRYHRHEFRKAHRFIASMLAEGLSDSDFAGVLDLIVSCGRGSPYPLAELLVRYGATASTFRQWLICYALGEIRSHPHVSATEFLKARTTAVGDRPRGILDQLFYHLGQQICDHLPKKVRRLEFECERLKKNKYYIPQLRSLKTDAIREQVYAALADGPKNKKRTRADVSEDVWRDLVCRSAATKRRPNHEHLARRSVYVGPCLHGAVLYSCARRDRHGAEKRAND
jgi:hypothetical protein